MDRHARPLAPRRGSVRTRRRQPGENGKKTGSLDPTARPTYFRVNGPDLRSGDNLSALWLFQPDHGAGIPTSPVKFVVETADGPVGLAGPWLAKIEFALPTLAPGQDAAPARPPFPPQAQDTASYLYDGMIAPLVPYALRGALWY